MENDDAFTDFEGVEATASITATTFLAQPMLPQPGAASSMPAVTRSAQQGAAQQQAPKSLLSKAEEIDRVKRTPG